MMKNSIKSLVIMDGRSLFEKMPKSIRIEHEIASRMVVHQKKHAESESISSIEWCFIRLKH